MIQDRPNIAAQVLSPSSQVIPLDPVFYSFSSGYVKRVIDIVAALVTLVLLSPLLILIGFAVKIGSNGPILYT